MGKINQKGIYSFEHPQNESTYNKVQQQGVSDNSNVSSTKETDNPKNVKHSDRISMRKELLQSVKDAADCLNEFGLTNYANQIIGMVKRTMQTRFSVSFVGEFNHGKSTLINKLIGQDILPTGSIPTTALLTKISDGKEERINVLDRSGKQIETLPLVKDSWDKLVAYNDEGKIGIDNNDRLQGFVTVTLPVDWLKKAGVDILDTPGANDGNRKRDLEISRALMVTDGAVICVDAQKGLMETQRAFIKDRIVSRKVPYMAIAITHLDLIAKENRDRQVLYIISALRAMNLDMPIVIANDVEMPSEQFKDILGTDRLKELISKWSANPERADKMEVWLAANVCRVLSLASQGYVEQKNILEKNGEEREKIITEKKSAILQLENDWQEFRNEIEKRCNNCASAFNRRYEHEIVSITEAMNNRIDISPDPKQWYEKSYKYELSKYITATLISLDNVVTENARNDFEWLNKELAKKFKVNAERSSSIWKRTEESSFYVHQRTPDMVDLSKLRQKENIKTSVAMIIGGITATVLTGGFGGLIGTVGVGTLMRSISTKKINEEVGKLREQLHSFIESDIKTILKDATLDSVNRIRLIYSDMVAGAYRAESNWIKAQYTMIEQSSKPSEDADENKLRKIDDNIKKINELIDNLLKYIH